MVVVLVTHVSAYAVNLEEVGSESDLRRQIGLESLNKHHSNIIEAREYLVRSGKTHDRP